ncbi:P-type conjugative transfer protein TrbL [Halothiobacillus neapolitanus]|uniref:P-type conjugative transfer protein TrbL n=1 Tax=Halothiobacillus neapolitanus (strain ATCC 23641 / DSM 15147 / CIP 104769 / NCIMB 8539 / c2) TaxID=555778 RepID=D0L169_HALNC|nr:P-type conjugative transfer protein TrbL [Halothiobacillus neapolitanus]ACX96442.1 P-type conjugative transfer protein TrbL [Halothiobacillus neapolitanus c2]TDN66757.1 type IV secretion system protein TrbL [Halothiobacillus neapolitanus]
MSTKSTNILILTTICLLLATSSASAASTSTGGMMMDLMDQFHTASVSWTTRALQIGNWIFYTLAVLELTWAAALWVMEKDSASSLIVALVRKFMVLGFFYTFLIMAPSWIPAIINSLQDTGAQIGDTTVGAVTPMSIVGHGINVINAIWKAFSNSALGSLKAMATAIVIGFLLIAVSIAIMLSFIYIAIEYVMTVIESYIVVGMGLVLMGFSGSQWTRDFSQKYIGYAFSVGVKLMVLMLLLATIITVTNTWPADVRATFTGKDMFAWIQPMFMIAGSSILMALLAIKIPSLASSLLSGAPSLGGAAAVGAAAGAAAGVAGMAVGGAKLAGMAGAAGGAATKGIAAAAVGGAGMAQAVGAASNLATASGFTPGSAAHMGATAGNMINGLGGMAANGMKNLSNKAGSALDAATQSAGKTFDTAVSNSTGGKLAASLNEKASGKQTSSGSQLGGGGRIPQAVVPPPRFRRHRPAVRRLAMEITQISPPRPMRVSI